MTTHGLVGIIGPGLLLLVSACLLMVAVFCIILLGAWARQYSLHRNEPGSEDAVGGGMLDGLKQIFTNPFIATMAVMMLLSDAIGTTAYVLITDYSGMAFPGNAVAQTRFCCRHGPCCQCSPNGAPAHHHPFFACALRSRQRICRQLRPCRVDVPGPGYP